MIGADVVSFADARLVRKLRQLSGSIERNRCGELASLYTLTRFLGEGVGAQIVSHVLVRARELGLTYVYACTTSERVVAFFERNGFRRVSCDELPASKWSGYDPARRALLACLRNDLVP